MLSYFKRLHCSSKRRLRFLSSFFWRTFLRAFGNFFDGWAETLLWPLYLEVRRPNSILAIFETLLSWISYRRLSLELVLIVSCWCIWALKLTTNLFRYLFFLFFFACTCWCPSTTKYLNLYVRDSSINLSLFFSIVFDNFSKLLNTFCNPSRNFLLNLSQLISVKVSAWKSRVQ